MLEFKEQNKFINAVTRTSNTKGMDQCIMCNKEESSAIVKIDSIVSREN